MKPGNCGLIDELNKEWGKYCRENSINDYIAIYVDTWDFYVQWGPWNQSVKVNHKLAIGSL